MNPEDYKKLTRKEQNLIREERKEAIGKDYHSLKGEVFDDLKEKCGVTLENENLVQNYVKTFLDRQTRSTNLPTLKLSTAKNNFIENLKTPIGDEYDAHPPSLAKRAYEKSIKNTMKAYIAEKYPKYFNPEDIGFGFAK